MNRKADPDNPLPRISLGGLHAHPRPSHPRRAGRPRVDRPPWPRRRRPRPHPPMGWNSWNKFGCNVSEQLIKDAADAMVANGMKDAGYRYVVINDCWQVSRDASGRIVADPERFASGMKALADPIHAKGPKFG